MNYKELDLREEKLNNEVENQGCYKAQNVEKIDKSKINMEVLNKIIAFKMLEIMRDNEMIDEKGMVQAVMPKVKPDTNADEIVALLGE